MGGTRSAGTLGMWDQHALAAHRTAAKLLGKIKDEVFRYLPDHPGVTEYEVQQFVRERLRHYRLRTDRHPPIVAFGPSTAQVHYFPSHKTARRLHPNTPIMLDVWARLRQGFGGQARLNISKAPFADITWMGFYGPRVPAEVQKVFDLVIEARDRCVDFLRTRLLRGRVPTGKELNEVVRTCINRAGYGKQFLHSTGHVLGFTTPHGRGRNLNSGNRQPLLPNTGYTIEPGVYLEKKFGARSEINFYFTPAAKVVVTTSPQRALVQIQ